MQHAHRKTFRLGLLLAVLLGLFTTLAPAPAHAADEGYRYWGVYELSGGKWKYATAGPAQAKAVDKGLYGFRYATVAGTDVRPPRDAEITFDRVCAGQKAAQDEMLVGLVIDYGRTADAPTAGEAPPSPRAQCAAVKKGSSVLGALKRVADVRTDAKGMLCGFDGYPAKGCADPVKKVPAEAKAKDTPLSIGIGEAPAAQQAAPAPPADAQTSATPTRPEGTDNGPSNGSVMGIGLLALLGLGLLAVLATRRLKKREEGARLVAQAAPARATSGATRVDETASAADQGASPADDR